MMRTEGFGYAPFCCKGSLGMGGVMLKPFCVQIIYRRDLWLPCMKACTTKSFSLRDESEGEHQKRHYSIIGSAYLMQASVMPFADEYALL